MRSLALSQLVAALAVVTACGDEPRPQPPSGFPAPPVAAEGEFVRIRTHHREWVAAGTAAYLDGFVLHAADLLEVAPPEPGDVIEYVWLPEGVDDSPCGVNHYIGCTIGTEIFTSFLPHQHELVHAVLHDLPRVDAFISEGVAEAVASSQRSAPDIAAARAMLGADRTREVDYGVAGRVLSYFIAEYGIDGLQELWTAAPNGSSGDEVAQAFETITGLSFERIVQDAFAQECLGPPMFECTLPELQWANGEIELEADLTPSGPETVGLSPALGSVLDDNGDPIGAFYIPRVVSIDSSVDFATSRGHLIHLRPCTCPSALPEYDGFQGTFDLDPGDYAVRFATGDRDTGPGWMRLSKGE